MKSYKLFLYSVLSALLFYLAFLPGFSGFLASVALLPLLWVEHHLYGGQKKSRQAFLYAYLSFGLFNIGAMWWLAYATWLALAAILLVNTSLFALVFYLYHVAKRRLDARFAYMALLAFWLAGEYLHSTWDLSFPWLFLGSALGKDIRLIQWYDYTGVAGGTLWLLLINLFIFRLLISFREHFPVRQRYFNLLFLLVLLVVPVLISLYRYQHYQAPRVRLSAVVLQPNIDPWLPYEQRPSAGDRLDRLLFLADSLGDGQTDYFIAPEEALPYKLDESRIRTAMPVTRIRTFLREAYPGAAFIVGLTTYRQSKGGVNEAFSCREQAGIDGCFQVFNTAIQVDTSDRVPVYHKSKLVIGAEFIPFPAFFSFLATMGFDVRSISGNLAYQDRRMVFRHGDSIVAAPVICYESAYGSFVGDYILGGANVIAVVTNDGWWGNTPGHRMHLSYSQMRAIETRRSILRSANTGISCFIDPKGEISGATAYGDYTAIKGDVALNGALTFYTRMGDYISRVAAFVSVLLLLALLVNVLKGKGAYFSTPSSIGTKEK